MPFDLVGARKEASDTEIADYLASKVNFDLAGARKSGASDTEIVNYLSTKVGQVSNPISAPSLDRSGKPPIADTGQSQPTNTYPTAKSLTEPLISPQTANKLLAPAVEGLGLVGGGILGMATGGPPLAVVGAGLGYAGAKRLTKTADVMLGNTPPETAQQAFTSTAKDVATGATSEMAGQGISALANNVLGKLTPFARKLYESSIKPVPSMPISQREKIISIGLDNAVKGLPYRPNEKSVYELGKNITNLVDTADNMVVTGAKSGDTVSVKEISNAIDSVKNGFESGPFPKSDVKLLDNLKKEFIGGKGFLTPNKIKELDTLKTEFEAQNGGIQTLANVKIWANIKSDFIENNKVMPVDEALAMKKRIYQIADKYYKAGQTSVIPAKVEAEKAVARSIKNELEAMFLETAPINAEASRQIEFGKVLERAAGRVGNREPFGLFDFLGGAMGATLHGGPGVAAGVVVSKATTSAQFKSIMAKEIMKAQVPDTVKKQMMNSMIRYIAAENMPKGE